MRMEDFWGKVLVVVYVGFVVLFYAWNFSTFFTPEQEQIKKEVSQEYTPSYIDDEEEVEYEEINLEEYEEETEGEDENLEEDEENFVCDCSKTCDEIYTCEEAEYQLYTCGCLERNKDKDRYACDLMCEPRY
jgi:hypothetical protein